MEKKQRIQIRFLVIMTFVFGIILLGGASTYMYNIDFSPAPYPSETYSSFSTIDDNTDKDTYINEASPDSNYGGQDYLYSGYSYGEYQLFLHFTFENKPNNWTKSELYLDICSLSKTTNFTIAIIDNSWNEYTTTWNNRPSEIQIMKTVLLTDDDSVLIDITDFIDGKTELSLVVRPTFDDTSSGYFFVYSREDAEESSWIDGCKIVFKANCPFLLIFYQLLNKIKKM